MCFSPGAHWLKVAREFFGTDVFGRSPERRGLSAGETNVLNIADQDAGHLHVRLRSRRRRSERRIQRVARLPKEHGKIADDIDENRHEDEGCPEKIPMRVSRLMLRFLTIDDRTSAVVDECWTTGWGMLISSASVGDNPALVQQGDPVRDL